MARRKRIKTAWGEWIGVGAIYVFIALMAMTCLFPYVNMLATSFSGEHAIVTGQVSIWPVEFHLNAYKTVLNDNLLFNAMKVSVIVTVGGTAVNLLLTSMTAFPLIKRDLYGRKFVMSMFVFTMMFSGGMIPIFLTIKQLKLLNKLWSLILPGAISPFNLIIMRTFFMAIPYEMQESAFMDGANDWHIFVRIYVPLSATVFATLGLFYAVGHWNAYTDALLYINDYHKFTLQVRLRQLIFAGQAAKLGDGMPSEDTQNLVLEAIKAAVVMVSTLPILVVYPWLQKYFVKGVMIGAIKG